MTDTVELNLPEPTGADFGFPGWVYRDIPNMSLEFFDKFVNIVGNDNLIWLTVAERKWADGSTSKRGQVLVSPEGLQNVAKWNNKRD